MAAAFASIAVLHFRQAPLTDQPEMRLEITTPATPAPLHFALSPDGRSLAFVASGDGAQRLWLRRLDQAEAQPLAGTDEAIFPFWSADNRAIGFFSSGKRKRSTSPAGLPVLTDVVGGRGGAWNADGTILFASSAVFRIPASGGEAVPVTRLAPSQTSHRFPRFLADGRHFIFYAQGTTGMQGIDPASLYGGEPKRLTAADTAGDPGPAALSSISQGALVTRRLDLKRGEVIRRTQTLADYVGSNASFRGGVSVSGDGRIAYRASGGERTQLTWHDRAGKPVGAAGQPDEQGLLAPEVSPDGRRVAVDRTVQGNRDVWLIDPPWAVSPDSRSARALMAFPSGRRTGHTLHSSRIGTAALVCTSGPRARWGRKRRSPNLQTTDGL